MPEYQQNPAQPSPLTERQRQYLAYLDSEARIIAENTATREQADRNRRHFARMERQAIQRNNDRISRLG